MHGRRPTISSTKGVVAAAHPLAAQAGARLLAQGGNAFDAAAATAAALNVVEPYMSGLAGAGLATCWVAAERRIRVLDFVPRVPQRFPVERFTRRARIWCAGRSRPACRAISPAGPSWCARTARSRSAMRSRRRSRWRATASRSSSSMSRRSTSTRPPSSAITAFHGEFARNYMGGGDKVEPGACSQAAGACAARSSGSPPTGPKLLYGGALGQAIVAHLEIARRLHDDGRSRSSSRRAGRTRSPSTIAAASVHVPPPPCEGFQFLLTLRILEGFDLARLERNGAEHLDIVYRAIRLAAGVRINNNNPPPQEAGAPARRRARREAARARARRPPDRRPDRAVDGAAGRGEDPGHTTSFSIARPRGQSRLRDPEPRQPVRQRRRRAGHGRVPQQFPLLDRGQSEQSPNRTKPGAELPMCMAPIDLDAATASRCSRSARPAATASCRPRRRRWCSTSISACRCRTRSRRRARGCGTAGSCRSRAASRRTSSPR